MKRFFQFLFAMTLIMSAQGCSNDSTEDPTNSTSVELRLKGYIKTIETTRVNADGFEVDDKVGVYVSATGSLSQQNNTLDNEAYTYSNGNLIAPVGKEAYWGSEDVRLSVWAYYPYAQDIENNAAYQFAVNDNQSTEEAFYNSDFITASATNLAPQTTPVELTFNHVLSKIDITLIAGDGITTEELTTATKSYSIKNLATSGTINLETGVATASTTSSDITPLATDGLNYSAIVYPQSGNITLRLKMNDNIYTYSTNVTYQAGYSYKYTLKINVHKTQEMALEAIAINPWNNGETTEGEMTQITPDGSDIIQFKDLAFKKYLLQEALYTNISYNPDEDKNKIAQRNQLTATSEGEQIDANNDGEISIAEAEKVLYINVRNAGVSDLCELHYFSNLQYLECDANYNQTRLTSLDISQNKALKFLQCAYNEFTSLDVSNNTELLFLDCGGTSLTTLDITNNTALRTLFCGSNQLSSLDVSKNTALTFIHCYNNQLPSLDVSNNIALDGLFCSANPLKTLDLSKNSALTFLWCYDNQLTTLDLSKNTAIIELNCSNNQLTSLDLSKNTKLQFLSCDRNQLSNLDVSNTILTYLYCNPMNDIIGNNLLTNIYIAQGQTIETIYKPEGTVIESK